MKEYPLSDADLTSLALLQGGSSFFFTLAGASGGFWLSVSQAIDFAEKSTRKDIVGYWQGLQTASVVIGVLSVLVAAVLFYAKGQTVKNIKDNTTHE